eukprot:gene6774-6471_t
MPKMLLRFRAFGPVLVASVVGTAKARLSRPPLPHGAIAACECGEPPPDIIPGAPPQTQCTGTPCDELCGIQCSQGDQAVGTLRCNGTSPDEGAWQADGRCEPCPVDTYWEQAVCRSCPQGSNTRGKEGQIGLLSCLCALGWSGPEGTPPCAICPADNWGTGTVCLPCPARTDT